MLFFLKKNPEQLKRCMFSILYKIILAWEANTFEIEYTLQFRLNTDYQIS